MDDKEKFHYIWIFFPSSNKYRDIALLLEVLC